MRMDGNEFEGVKDGMICGVVEEFSKKEMFLISTFFVQFRQSKYVPLNPFANRCLNCLDMHFYFGGKTLPFFSIWRFAQPHDMEGLKVAATCITFTYTIIWIRPFSFGLHFLEISRRRASNVTNSHACFV